MVIRDKNEPEKKSYETTMMQTPNESSTRDIA
jgi:hypothetical protein